MPPPPKKEEPKETETKEGEKKETEKPEEKQTEKEDISKELDWCFRIILLNLSLVIQSRIPRIPFR